MVGEEAARIEDELLGEKAARHLQPRVGGGGGKEREQPRSGGGESRGEGRVNIDEPQTRRLGRVGRAGNEIPEGKRATGNDDDRPTARRKLEEHGVGRGVREGDVPQRHTQAAPKATYISWVVL